MTTREVLFVGIALRGMWAGGVDPFQVAKKETDAYHLS